MLMIPNCMQSVCQCIPNGSFNNEVFDFLEFLRRAGFKSTGIMENKTRIRSKSDLVSNVVDPTLDDPSNRSCNVVQCLRTHHSRGIHASLAGINLIASLVMCKSWDDTQPASQHTSLPRQSRIIGLSFVSHIFFRTVVFPALARPKMSILNRGNFFLISTLSEELSKAWGWALVDMMMIDKIDCL